MCRIIKHINLTISILANQHISTSKTMAFLGVIILAALIFLATTTTDKNPKLRPFWKIIGSLMFFLGSTCLIVNSVGLPIGFLQWIEMMGPVGSFFFKLGLVFGGVAIFALVNHDPDAYDEYFDGKE